MERSRNTAMAHPYRELRAQRLGGLPGMPQQRQPAASLSRRRGSRHHALFNNRYRDEAPTQNIMHSETATSAHYIPRAAGDSAWTRRNGTTESDEAPTSIWGPFDDMQKYHVESHSNYLGADDGIAIELPEEPWSTFETRGTMPGGGLLRNRYYEEQTSRSAAPDRESATTPHRASAKARDTRATSGSKVAPGTPGPGPASHIDLRLGSRPCKIFPKTTNTPVKRTISEDRTQDVEVRKAKLRCLTSDGSGKPAQRWRVLDENSHSLPAAPISSWGQISDELRDGLSQQQQHPRLWECTLCAAAGATAPVTFSTQKDLLRHIDTKHSEKRPFFCACGRKIIGRKDNFKRHLRQCPKHEAPAGRFVCGCGLTSDNAETMLSHLDNDRCGR